MKTEVVNNYEKEIVIFIYRLGKRVSTRTIAKDVGIHWTTAKKNLESLKKKNIVKKYSLSNRTLWDISPNFKKKL